MRDDKIDGDLHLAVNNGAGCRRLRWACGESCRLLRAIPGIVAGFAGRSCRAAEARISDLDGRRAALPDARWLAVQPPPVAVNV